MIQQGSWREKNETDHAVTKSTKARQEGCDLEESGALSLS
jgi:hypothetical protein